MINEERVLYINQRRYEYIGFWNENSGSAPLGSWIYDPTTQTYTLAVSCLLSQDHKYEEKETFVFAYDETTGFKYTNNLKKLYNLSIEQIHKLTELIINCEPELFSTGQVKKDRLRTMFSAS